MSASPKPSKFQGLFKQAQENPLSTSEPEGRNEHPTADDPPSAAQSARVEGAVEPDMSQAPAVAPTSRAGQGAPAGAAKRAMGRPAGKRTDKDWKQFSVLLRHEDQFQAVSILRSTRDKRDFSTLMQGLLEAWLRKQTPKS
jgi:hypothetical protein